MAGKTKQWLNELYYGDNLGVLREHVASESVDLIYLDPPGNCNGSSHVRFQEKLRLRSVGCAATSRA